MVCVAVAEILIEGLGDEIVLVVVWAEQAKHVGVDLQPGGVAADRVMLDAQLSGCHAGSLQAFEAKAERCVLMCRLLAGEPVWARQDVASHGQDVALSARRSLGEIGDGFNISDVAGVGVFKDRLNAANRTFTWMCPASDCPIGPGLRVAAIPTPRYPGRRCS